MASARLRRSERLRDRRDYLRLSGTGRRAASASFVVLVVERDASSGAQGPRLGITASRRVGGAVQRNRVKRRVREWFRGVKDTLPANLDLVVIARADAARQAAGETPAELTRLVREASA